MSDWGKVSGKGSLMEILRFFLAAAVVFRSCIYMYLFNQHVYVYNTYSVPGIVLSIVHISVSQQ